MNFSVTRSMLRLVDSDYQLDLNNCQYLNANNSYFTFLFIYSTKVRAAFCYFKIEMTVKSIWDA